MHKASQQYWYISEIAVSKPCLFICSGLQVQIASANLLGTNAIINVCKCQRLSSWLNLHYLPFSALKWSSAGLFKNILSPNICKCAKCKSFLFFWSFLNGRKKKITVLLLEWKFHSISIAFAWGGEGGRGRKSAIKNNFRLQIWKC